MNAAARAGRSWLSHRTEDLVSGKRTAMLPLPPLALLLVCAGAAGVLLELLLLELLPQPATTSARPTARVVKLAAKNAPRRALITRFID